MFAVPGWSVSSGTLKTQVSQSVKPTTGAAATVPDAAEKSTNKAHRKRKRNSGASKASDVNSANLADLWETIIEKNPQSKRAGDAKGQKHEEYSGAGRPDGSRSESSIFASNLSTLKSQGQEQEFPKPKRPKTPKDKKRGKTAKNSTADDTTPADTYSAKVEQVEQVERPIPQLTPLQSSMRQKLVSARFRHLNQTLYTSPSSQSLDLFQQNPEMFQEYHEGFRKQVEVWPENPVDGYIEQIRRRAMHRGSTRGNSTISGIGEQGQYKEGIVPLPRTEGVCHLADLGCGDAGISKALEKEKKKLRLQIFSYDLQNSSPLVTKADIANLPLADGSVDAAIFCLALMGTNWIDFIDEAYRILRWKGELWIAEIKSRFGRVGSKGNRVDHSVGNKMKPTKQTIKKAAENNDDTDLLVHVDGHEDNKGQTDVTAFVEVLRKRGFVLQHNQAVDLSNKMFVRMSFVKGVTPIKGKNVPLPKGMAELGVDTWKMKAKAKFIVNDVDTSTISSESSVLKPCVYKLR